MIYGNHVNGLQASYKCIGWHFFSILFRLTLNYSRSQFNVIQFSYNDKLLLWFFMFSGIARWFYSPSKFYKFLKFYVACFY